MDEDITTEEILPKLKTSIQIKTPIVEVEEMSNSEISFRSSMLSVLDTHKSLKLEEKSKRFSEKENYKCPHKETSPLYLPKFYDLIPETFTEVDAGKSYVSNNDSESRCVEYVENFIRQYHLLYKDRKPVLLIPKNEYNVRKFISTFIKPTNLPFRELYKWEDISLFVSDYLEFVPVLPSTEFPYRILSSTTVLDIQKGTSFEFANLLCSLLLGVGYDAYVVTGYATRECCFMDESRRNCPFLNETIEKKIKNKGVSISKYMVKPAKDLKSKYELYYEARKIHEAELEKKKLENERLIEEKIKEKPPPDPLTGLRVHSWILIKAPLREVANDFFVEPLTGQRVELTDKMFQGIESIYNDQNCWVNMQDCSNGIQRMEYNLDHLFKWEFVLPTTLSYQNAEVVKLTSFPSDEGKQKTIGDEGLLSIVNCPSSWLKPIEIKLSDYERRFPKHIKFTTFYKLTCERYSPYLNPNGLIMKLTLYTDRTLSIIVDDHEFYCNKGDRLYQIIRKDGWTKEFFHEGRSHQLMEHHFETSYPEPETKRTLIFNTLRVDGLLKRVESPTSLTEYYADRQDRLIYLSCQFTERIVTFTKEQSHYRNIERITKRYDRNYNLPFADDVKEIVFYVNEDRIFVTYHVDTFGIIPNTREYMKPAPTQDGKNTIPFYVDTHYHFRANPINQSDKSKLEVYQQLLQLIDDEAKTKNNIRWSENETKNILHCRRREKIHHELEKSLFDTLRNKDAKQRRIELEEMDETEKNKRTEDELDYLGPFLSQLNLADIDTREQAFLIREECLQDYKQRLIENANIIQSRFETETRLLQKNQQWYQQNQMTLNKEDEMNYINACNTSAFKINTLETMLAKHKQVAPHRYMALERRIRNDPRMKPFFAYL